MQVTQDDIFVKRFLAYFHERFPLPPIAFFITLFAFNCYTFGELIIFNAFKPFVTTFQYVAILVVFLTLFHLRIFDDLISFKEESKLYPDRVLSRGVLSLMELIKTLFVILGLEFILAFFLGPRLFLYYFILFFFSLLSLRGFFLKSLFRNSPLYKFFCYQLLTPLIVFYLIATAIFPIWMVSSVRMIYAFILLSFPLAFFEIGRKLPFYEQAWGKKRVVAFLLFLLLVQFTAGTLMATALSFSKIGTVLHLVSLIFALYTIVLMVREKGEKNVKPVRISLTILLFTIQISCLIGAYLR